MPKNYKTKITREKAIQKLNRTLELAEQWNNYNLELYDIDKILLVGSLARNEGFVGDVDICVRTYKYDFEIQGVMESYLEWRKNELGYAEPRSYFDQLRALDCDPARFIKNRDGRIELMDWDQNYAISLTMQPQLVVFDKGKRVFDDIEAGIKEAKAIPLHKAEDIINNVKRPRNPCEKEGVYWDSYCQSLAKYPKNIRTLILDRDTNHKNYRKYFNQKIIPKLSS